MSSQAKRIAELEAKLKKPVARKVSESSEEEEPIEKKNKDEKKNKSSVKSNNDSRGRKHAEDEPKKGSKNSKLLDSEEEEEKPKKSKTKKLLELGDDAEEVPKKSTKNRPKKLDSGDYVEAPKKVTKSRSKNLDSDDDEEPKKQSKIKKNSSAVKSKVLDSDEEDVKSSQNKTSKFNSRNLSDDEDDIEYASKPKATKSSVSTVQQEPSKSKKNLSKDKVMQARSEKMTIDVQFIMDCTGSMGSWIAEAKSKIVEISNQVKSKWSGYKIRFSFIGYRDFTDSVPIEKLDFVEEPSKFESFLGKVDATGGGDAAEDVFSGLREAASCSWSSYIRLAFIVADAPAHGSDFHDMGAAGDNYLSRAGCDRNGCKQLFEKLKEQKVKNLFFIHIDNCTTKMEKQFDVLWSNESSGYSFTVGNLNQNPGHFLKFVVESISSSVASQAAQRKAIDDDKK